MEPTFTSPSPELRSPAWLGASDGQNKRFTRPRLASLSTTLCFARVFDCRRATVSQSQCKIPLDTWPNPGCVVYSLKGGVRALSHAESPESHLLYGPTLSGTVVELKGLPREVVSLASSTSLVGLFLKANVASHLQWFKRLRRQISSVRSQRHPC